ncbi:MAG: SCP2 sterol-binding domain-containing protein [Deltaproteobacteria bacterium]|nr:SCP2 sterol-binding domain-containing protein [Deltaproteobacteria bacterium]
MRDSVKGINAVYQFKVTGDNGGDWYADVSGETPKIEQGMHDSANCTITVASDDFVAIKTGKLSGQMAFMTGKLKIQGDMGLAMKLQKLLG